MEKCLVKAYKLSGGSPRSLYQYLSILKKKGCHIHVIAAHGDASLEEQYRADFDTVEFEPCIEELFWSKKLVSMEKQVWKEKKILESEKPDLVLALGAMSVLYYSHFCNQLGTNFIGIIAGGNLATQSEIVTQWAPCKVICFSKENEAVITANNPEVKPFVISNRIELQEEPFGTDLYREAPMNVINLLLVSRLDDDKYSSVRRFIDLLTSMEYPCPVCLKIAGGGAMQKNVEEYAAEKERENLRIQVLGHIDQLYDLFRTSHIVFGKGRSILEPIMLNRLGCVIGDDGKFEFCTPDTFDNLYHYNFSGRKIEHQNMDEVLRSTISGIAAENYSTDIILDTAVKVKEKYSAEYLEPYFNDVINEEKYSPNHASPQILLLRNIYAGLKQKVKKKVKKDE